MQARWNSDAGALRMSRGTVAVIALLGALVLPAAATAKRNVYVSNSCSGGSLTCPLLAYGPGAIASFDIAPTGELSSLAGSPVGTGQIGSAGEALTPDGNHLYVTNWISGTVSGYDVGADGALTATPGSPFASVIGAAGITVAPDGRHLYVANRAYLDHPAVPPAGVISAYRIHADGSLSPVPGSPFTAGTGTATVVMSPDGAHVFALNTYGSNDITVYRVAPNGALQQVTGSPFPAAPLPRAAAISPHGNHLYVANKDNNISVYGIAADGALSEIAGSPFAAGNTPYGIAMSPDGAHLYVNNALGFNISVYDIAAGGALSQIAGSPFATGMAPTGSQLTPDGKRFYVSNAFSNNVYAYRVAADGSLTAVGSPVSSQGFSPSFQSVAITPDQGPIAAFSASLPVIDDQPTTFDANASADPDGSIARYDWSFGDGSTLPDGGPTPIHTYAQRGVYSVKLTVTDDEGCSARQVFTGAQTLCNGSRRAATEREIVMVRKAPVPHGKGG